MHVSRLCFPSTLAMNDHERHAHEQVIWIEKRPHRSGSAFPRVEKLFLEAVSLSYVCLSGLYRIVGRRFPIRSDSSFRHYRLAAVSQLLSE